MRSKSNQLDRDGRRFAAANAEAGNPAPFAARLQRIQQRRQNPRAGRADRMPQGAGTAIDIRFLVIQSQVLHRCHRHRGKRFIDLVQIDVIGLPIQLRQQFLDGAHRRQREPLGLARKARVTEHACQGLSRFIPAKDSRVNTTAAAPSEMPEELAAVTVPSFLNAGFKVGNLCDIEREGVSSLSTRLRPCEIWS